MPLTVSTTCPSCGGGVDYEEGSNAVRCSYCGANHVVTGRGRVLSYYIPEKIPAQRAVALSLMKLKSLDDGVWRAKDASLFFVPFYHFVGQELSFKVVEAPAGPHENGTREKMELSLGGIGLDWFEHDAPTRFAVKRFELVSRHVDKTMPALDMAPANVYSLGIRPEVLKLSLFEHAAVSRRGRIARAVPLDPAGMEDAGYSAPFGEEAVARCVFGRNTSIIYFPFWLVEVSKEAGGGQAVNALSVVDGISGDVPNPRAPMSLLDKLVSKDGIGFEVAGLRPLKCPDCAWDLPVRPKDAIFICPNCSRAWHISGSGFNEVAYKVFPHSPKAYARHEHFPFWVVKARMRSDGRLLENKYDLAALAPGLTPPREEDRGVPLRFFVPAFRMGNLRALSRLAGGFTRNQPLLQDTPGVQAQAARGCYLSPEDALLLAPVILFSLVPKTNTKAVRFALDATLEAISAELVFFPFLRGGPDYVDGVFGLAVPVASVKD